MINFIIGKLIEKHPTKITLLCGGIGFEIIIPVSTYSLLPEVNDEIKIITYLHIREDNWQFFGFMSYAEKDLFKQLINISGIGPKVAISILSGIGIDSFKEAIANEDLTTLTSISGIGRKTAGRILVELKEKIVVDIGNKINVVSLDSEYKDAVAALVSLGYNRLQSEKSVTKVVKENKEKKLSLEEIIKLALSMGVK